jgi:hypothetical protein
MLDINTLAAWGEFIGAIAVVISLVYLATQIRQNSKLLRASTASAATEIDARPGVLMVQDPEVARIYWNGIADRDSLSETDRQRFDALMYVDMKGQSQHFHFNREGLTGPEARQALEGDLSWSMSLPGMRDWWTDWRGHFDDAFGAFVDEVSARADSSRWPKSPTSPTTP